MVAAEERMAGHEIGPVQDGRLHAADLRPGTGYVQCNIVILPLATPRILNRSARSTPSPALLAVSEQPGDPSLPRLGTDIDIRTDVPQYRVWHDGVLTEQRRDIVDLWQDDWVAFALGCSFS